MFVYKSMNETYEYLIIDPPTINMLIKHYGALVFALLANPSLAYPQNNHHNLNNIILISIIFNMTTTATWLLNSSNDNAKRHDK